MEVEIRKFNDLQDTLTAIYGGGGGMSYCQSPFWSRFVNDYTQGNFIKRLAFGKCKYYCVLDNDKIVLIAPLIVKDNVATIIGKNCAVDYFDFIYSRDCQSQHYEFLFNYLKTRRKIQKIIIPFLNGTTPTYELLNGCSSCKITKTDLFNVALDFEFDTYEEYYKYLSKSERQNIRTAYNRLATDKLTYSFEEYSDNIDNALATECFLLHKNRLNTRYQLIKRRFVNSKLYLLLKSIVCGKYGKDIIIIQSMLLQHDHKLFILRINNKISAFYYGLTQNDTIHFIRVCIDDKFAKYSPGILLAHEIFKKYTNKFKLYDFTVGDEKYKYNLGCVNKICYGITINLE